MFTGDGFSLNSGFRNILFTGDGFSLISGFTKILCTPENPLLGDNLKRWWNDLKKLFMGGTKGSKLGGFQLSSSLT